MVNRPAHIEFRTKILAGGVLAVISLIGVMTMPPFTNFLGGQTSMLSVHLLMELFAIIIAMLVVTVSWHTFDAHEARSANILICGFVIIASCDLVHALTYKGMPALLAESSTPRAIFFWLMGRTFEVVTMLLVALAWVPPLSRGFWLSIGLITSGVLIWFGSYNIDAFPLTFVTGKGVTPFKAIYEYVLCTANLLVAILFWQQAQRTGETRHYLLSLSSFVMGIGELAFTSYVAPSDFQNIFGHSYKLMAYALIYRATFVSSIRAPFEEIRRSEERLSESRARYHSALSSLSEGVLIQRGDGQILEANGAAGTILGLSVEQLIGRNSSEAILHPIHEDGAPWPAAIHPAMETLKTGKTLPEATMGIRKPDGSLAWISINSRPIVTPGDPPALTVVTSFVDITERKISEDQIHHLAYFDALTLLPNRRLLTDRLRHAMATGSRTLEYGALLFIDMDNFKALNDTRGHNVGDMLLIEVAQRLHIFVRDMDTVARLGGDEFVVLLESLSKNREHAAEQAMLVGEKIRDAAEQPYRLQGMEYHCSASIGISLFCGDSDNLDDLLKHADAAMYQAKNAGRNALRFFDPNMQTELEGRTRLEADLRYALAENQLQLYYQIQVNSQAEAIGAEALLRWHHPTQGLISPLQFIPIAEISGLIMPIGVWVLQTACAQIKDWQTTPLTSHLQLAVNVSARQFGQTSFVPQVLEIIQSSGIDPKYLKLELTESLLLENIASSITKMQALRDAGVRISMDDFGTGHSSLSYLRRLPLDQIKIDQSFVRDIATDEDDASIVMTIIMMAHNLGMEVIAEGVETEQQREFLENNGCNLYQGYLFGKPTPIADFQTALRH